FVFTAIFALAFAAPEPKPKAKPGLVAAAYTSPVVGGPAAVYTSAYTSPLVYSAGYVAPSFYSAGYRAYPAYSPPLVVL
ncbi:hypothetical protein BDFB_013624, partial [Asbolus verrucosus]